MDLLDHVRAIWRRKFRILALAAVVVVLVFLRSSSADEVFAADSRLLVAPGSAGTADDAIGFVAAGYAELLGTDPVLAAAAEAAGLDVDADGAGERLTAAASPDTGFITIDATGPTPSDAADLAQGAAEALVAEVADQQEANRSADLAPIDEEIGRIDAEIAAIVSAAVDPQAAAADPRVAALGRERDTLSVRRVELLGASDTTLTIVQPARPNEDPVAPTPLRDAIVALVLALVLGAELMVVLDLVSGRFTPGASRSEVADELGLPVLARIALGSADARLEGYRTLRTNLMFLAEGGNGPGGDWASHRLRNLAIVSVDEGDGRTSVVIGLGEAVAAVGVDVVLVDGDLRRSALHDLLGVERSPGIGDVGAEGDLSATARLVPGGSGLRVVPAGAPVADPSATMSALRGRLDRIDAELVLVDTPSSRFAEAQAIAAQCDAFVVVVDATASRRRDVADLVRDLRTLGARPVGVVLNRVQRT